MASALPSGAHLVVRPKLSGRPAATVGETKARTEVIPALAENATGPASAEVAASSAGAVLSGPSVPDVVRSAATST